MKTYLPDNSTRRCPEYDYPTRVISSLSPRTRPTLPSDVTSIADLQTAYLKGSLVTEFGHRFLRRFHHISLTAPSTCAFVAVEGDVIVGFVLGTLDVHAFNARVKPRILGSLATALAAPRRWRLLMSLVRGIAEREPQPGIPAELLLLVVEAKGRRRGIGRHLLGVLEAAFSAGAPRRARPRGRPA